MLQHVHRINHALQMPLSQLIGYHQITENECNALVEMNNVFHNETKNNGKYYIGFI